MEQVTVYVTEDQWTGGYKVFTNRNDAINHILNEYKDIIIDVVRDSTLDDLRLIQNGTLSKDAADIIASNFETIKEDLSDLLNHGYISEFASIYEAELKN